MTDLIRLTSNRSFYRRTAIEDQPFTQHRSFDETATRDQADRGRPRDRSTSQADNKVKTGTVKQRGDTQVDFYLRRPVNPILQLNTRLSMKPQHAYGRYKSSSSQAFEGVASSSLAQNSHLLRTGRMFETEQVASYGGNTNKSRRVLMD